MEAEEAALGTLASYDVSVESVDGEAPERLDPAIAHGRDLARAGSVGEALAELEALRPRARRRARFERAVLLATLIDCRLARGDLSEAMSLGDAVGQLLEAGGAVAAVAHHARGEVALALGDPELALAHFLTVGQLDSSADADLTPWRAGAALASTLTGDPRGASLLAHRFVDEARADARPHLLALALRTLAAVDPAGGSGDRVAHLRAARALLPAGTADRLAAQIDTDLAGLLLMDPGGRAEAVALLRSAERLASRERLWPLQSRVRRHLERLDETPRRVDQEAAALLTAAELRVCRLAVEGHSNRLIGEELGVSIKAVEWHLGHVYRKLAIGTRAELAHALGAALGVTT